MRTALTIAVTEAAPPDAVLRLSTDIASTLFPRWLPSMWETRRCTICVPAGGLPAQIEEDHRHEQWRNGRAPAARRGAREPHPRGELRSRSGVARRPLRLHPRWPP